MSGSLNLLHELRTRLIADVVTGKLDVREAAAALPDTPDDEPLVDDEAALEDGDEEPEGDASEDDEG